MKKTIYTFLLFILSIPLQCMEQRHVSQLPPSIAQFLDKELIAYSLHSNPTDLMLYAGGNSCMSVTPKPVIGLETNSTKLDEYGNWQSPLNLNPGKIGYANEDTIEDRLFSLQCWQEGTNMNVVPFLAYGSPRYINFRIDDDVAGQRFMALTPLQITKVLFDGKNKHGFVLVSGKIKKTEHDYQPCVLPKYAQKFATKYAVFLARMTQEHTIPFKDNNYGEQGSVRLPSEIVRYTIIFNKEGKQIGTRLNPKPLKFDYEEIQEGTLQTLALCNNANRFVVIDDKINLYNIITDHNSKVNTKLLCSGMVPKDILIKKISFLTPRTLIGLTSTGQLYTFAYNEKKQNIEPQRQNFLNRKKEPITFNNYAVNAKKPYQMILQTTQGQLVYWTTRHCAVNPHQGRVIFDKKDCVNLWYYKNTLTLMSRDNKVETHLVKNYDLRVQLNTNDI